MARNCPLCEGRGCEDCDYTGRRYRQAYQHGDTTIHISGSGEGASPELAEALAELAEAAFGRMTDARRGKTP